MSSLADPTSLPWPYWLLRYSATNTESTFSDAVWSVGGSPPYGGVAWEEAEAVYELLEAYRGPSQAPESAYAKVASHLAGRPDDVLALEAFRMHDRIASDPEAYGADDVLSGLQVARRLEHDGLASYFLLLGAQLAHQAGDIASAKSATFEALPVLVELSVADAGYVEQLAKAAQNGASFAVMDGDIEAARVAAEVLRQLGLEERLGPLAEQLLQRDAGR